MTIKDLKYLTVEEREHLAAAAASLGNMAEAIYNADALEDMSNTWSSMEDVTRSLELWLNDNDIEIELTYAIISASDEAGYNDGERSGDALAQLMLFVEKLLDTVPDEKTYTVRDHEYTQSDLLSYLDLTVELMKDSPGVSQYQAFIERKVEAIKANFTAKGFHQTVSDLVLIQKKMLDDQEAGQFGRYTP